MKSVVLRWLFWMGLVGVAAASGVAAKSQDKDTVISRPASSKLVAGKRKAAAVRVARSVVRRDAVRPKAGSSSRIKLISAQPTSSGLAIRSNAALVVDEDTNEVLYRKNEQAVLPIASITKLMTGLLVTEAQLSMDERIVVTQADVDTEKGTSSRLAVGAELSRGELLHLALMSSENRAAHALGRTYPGGMAVFVGLMNAKAKSLGMKDTRYVEPTGLSSKNQSSARDLALLVKEASENSVLREFSTSPGHQVDIGDRTLQFNNTNRLVKNPDWDIVLQKTGYIAEAGQCLVMQARVAGRNIIMVFLDAAGKLTRIADAQRVRKWVETRPTGTGLKLSSYEPISYQLVLSE